MNEKEAYIQKAILEWLKLNKIFAWRNHTTGIFNPKYKGFIPTGFPGVSDILGILPDGRFLAIEVKKKGGKPTQNQIDFIENINKNKGVGFIAYSVDDVIKELK